MWSYVLLGIVNRAYSLYFITAFLLLSGSVMSDSFVERAIATHSSTLAWKIPWTDHALQKEMATHSSVVAWRIPGTGEPGGLPSTGLHRVGHD